MKRLLIGMMLFAATLSTAFAYTPKDVDAAIASGDYSKAEMMLRQVINEHSDMGRPRYELANVLYHEHKYGEAKVVFDQGVALDKARMGDTVDDMTRLESDPVKAELSTAPYLPDDVKFAMDNGDVPGAEQIVRQIIAINPNLPKPHYVLAQILAHEGNLDEAKSELDSSAQHDTLQKIVNTPEFARFRAHLDQALAPAPTPAQQVAATPSPTSTTSSSPMGQLSQSAVSALGDSYDPFSGPIFGILVVTALVFVLVWGFKALSTSYGRDNSSASPPRPMSSAGQPQSTSYQPQPVYYESSSGHSTGSVLAAGALGYIAGQELERERQQDHILPSATASHFDDSSRSADAYNEVRTDPIDYGSSNSWTDNSGGGMDSGGGGGDNSWT